MYILMYECMYICMNVETESWSPAYVPQIHCMCLCACVWEFWTCTDRRLRQRISMIICTYQLCMYICIYDCITSTSVYACMYVCVYLQCVLLSRDIWAGNKHPRLSQESVKEMIICLGVCAGHHTTKNCRGNKHPNKRWFPSLLWEHIYITLGPVTLYGDRVFKWKPHI